MANGAIVTTTAPGLAFPRASFAKLTPGPFLQAHLKQNPPTRPGGRAPTEFRKPDINTGSLTHSNGSAVVRVGDTAIVCGVRAEILLAADIPHSSREDEAENDDDLVEELGLVVPNFELSTGCSPAHLPGNPPSTLAQTLTYRILSLLHSSRLISARDLKIQHTEPTPEDEDLQDAELKVATKGYWALYIDILCIALDGNAFDAAWSAVLAALSDTMLPKAWWDQDREAIVCSPDHAEAHKLWLKALPIASTFAVFNTRSPLKRREETEHWLLADPDGFEEEVCSESVTIVVEIAGEREGKGRLDLLRVGTTGGGYVGKVVLRRCVTMAEKRAKEWETVLKAG